MFQRWTVLVVERDCGKWTMDRSSSDLHPFMQTFLQCFYIHTPSKVQCLPQGHLRVQPVGVEDRVSLPPEPKPPPYLNMGLVIIQYVIIY